MKKSISLLVMAAVLTACSSAQKNKNVNKNLKNSSSRISMNYSQEDYSGFSSDLKDNRVFLAGELHGIQENYTLRLNLLMYLNENAGVNYYLAEMGYSSSYFINKYLETGEEKYLYVVANSIIGSYDYSQDDVNFWKDLYKYNQGLPKEKRIKVVGLDIEHQFWLAVMQLNDIVEDVNLGGEMETILGKLEYYSAAMCPSIADSRDILQNVKNIQTKNVLEVVADLREDYNANPEKYREVLPEEDFQDFVFVLNNITDTERIYTNRRNKEYFNKEREKAIYKNFLRTHEMYSDGKFFGQWGSFHVLQKSDNHEERFAQYLNGDDSPVKDEVISIKYIYDNKYHRRTNRKILSAFKQYGDSKFTLYRLDTQEHGADICPLNDHGIEDVSEFFQYGILIRDPQKVTPMSS
ncbi:hypothetical protein PM10SUCC1_12720 [Propionigenium maris DSM 9537]|uniref:Erythromycin esterase n=1 Tax=Propionigenium maris DSM 9537 TaxID=1123000 RepID=A0A9W6LMS0_9FUSO|nr:erythromycin esterase family protein [Propionigenium maris]GLI55758.1 hypothetical protein PM10SUCC1_12720 [Propionigenium maris DSM 9537]